MSAASTTNPFVAAIASYLQPGGIQRFAIEVLGMTPDDWQGRVMDDVGNPEVRQIAVRSCHGTGKSTTASVCMLWALLTHVNVKVVVTAPTSGQLFDALFAELKTLAKRMPQAWQDLIDVKTDKLTLTSAPDAAFISARTARAESPEALQGIHSDFVLLVVDEASGVPEAVFEAAVGSMSGENATTLMLGNPTRTSGYFYDAFHKNASDWKTYHISYTDSTRVSKAFVEQVGKTYGVDSNAYRVRVLGEFPKSDDDTIISLELAEAAKGRDVAAYPGAERVWGLDCARFGDDKSVLYELIGGIEAQLVDEWRKLDTMQLAGKVKARWDSSSADERPTEINVDAIGIGAGVADRLRELGLPVNAINVSEAPSLSSGDVYRNLRTELWFKGRDWFAQRIGRLPEDSEALIADLVSVKYGVDSAGKTYVEPKDATKKRLRRSPDHADAFLLCFAGSAVTLMGGKKAGWGKPLRRGLVVA